MAALTTTVVIATLGRPEHVADCLAHLEVLRTRPDEVIVVDASADTRTRDVVRDDFPDAAYLRNDLGRGRTPESRQIGLAAARGDIVVFIDDDANAFPDWLDELLAPYADPEVAGVGGRASNGVQGEEAVGIGGIGRLLPNGMLSGYFGADPGRVIDVDHLLGANMSFRRDVLLAMGGIRGNYPGTCLCEESDISLRLRRDGKRLVFAPRALVHHVGGAFYVTGRRFNRRYLYYARRNHVVMLARVYGFRTPLLPRFIVSVLRAQREYARESVRRLIGGPDAAGRRPTMRERLTAPLLASRSVAELAGLIAGFPAAASARRQDRREGRR